MKLINSYIKLAIIWLVNRSVILNVVKSAIGTISPGGVGGEPPQVSTPFLPGSEKKRWLKKGPSNQLKNGEQDAYRLPIIATRGFCGRQWV